MNSQLIEAGVSPGATWTPKVVRHHSRAPVSAPKKKAATLTELKQKLAKTRNQRLAAAKENCTKLTGKQSF